MPMLCALPVFPHERTHVNITFEQRCYVLGEVSEVCYGYHTVLFVMLQAERTQEECSQKFKKISELARKGEG